MHNEEAASNPPYRGDSVATGQSSAPPVASPAKVSRDTLLIHNNTINLPECVKSGRLENIGHPKKKALTHCELRLYEVPPLGIEPRTYGLRVRCSAD